MDKKESCFAAAVAMSAMAISDIPTPAISTPTDNAKNVAALLKEEENVDQNSISSSTGQWSDPIT